MNYKLVKPCDLCPFRRDAKHLVLSRDRAIEIGGQMLSLQGGQFVCHKTAKIVDGEFVDAGESSSHCAGALIFAEKNGNATQMMRIAERLGAYDASALQGQEQVFDDLDEMAEASLPVRRARKPRRKHSGFSQVRCPICAPLRCVRAK